MQPFHKVGCLTTGCSVAYSDGFYLIGFYHALHRTGGFYTFRLWRIRIDGFVMQQIALSIQTDHLATGTEARVDAHHTLLPQWWGKQQLAQILRKDLDALFIGLFLCHGSKFRFDGRFQKALIAIGHRLTNQPTAWACASHVVTLQLLYEDRLIGRDRYPQETFSLSTTHGQQTVGRAAFQRFRPVEVIREFSGSFFLSFRLDYLRSNDSLTTESPTKLVA